MENPRPNPLLGATLFEMHFDKQDGVLRALGYGQRELHRVGLGLLHLTYICTTTYTCEHACTRANTHKYTHAQGGGRNFCLSGLDSQRSLRVIMQQILGNSVQFHLFLALKTERPTSSSSRAPDLSFIPPPGMGPSRSGFFPEKERGCLVLWGSCPQETHLPKGWGVWLTA